VNNLTDFKPKTESFKTRKFSFDLRDIPKTKIDSLLKHNGNKGKNRMLVRSPNLEKSLLTGSQANKYSRLLKKSDFDCSVLYLRLTSPSSLKEVCEYLIIALGAKPNGTFPMLERQLIRLLKNLNVKLIIIDKLHHVLSNKNGSLKAQIFADTIKHIIEESFIPILLNGLKASSQKNTDRYQANTSTLDEVFKTVTLENNEV